MMINFNDRSCLYQILLDLYLNPDRNVHVQNRCRSWSNLGLTILINSSKWKTNGKILLDIDSNNVDLSARKTLSNIELIELTVGQNLLCEMSIYVGPVAG